MRLKSLGVGFFEYFLLIFRNRKMSNEKKCWWGKSPWDTDYAEYKFLFQEQKALKIYAKRSSSSSGLLKKSRGCCKLQDFLRERSPKNRRVENFNCQYRKKYSRYLLDFFNKKTLDEYDLACKDWCLFSKALPSYWSFNYSSHLQHFLEILYCNWQDRVDVFLK